MNRKTFFPIFALLLVVSGYISVIAMMAGTNLFDPLVKFIHQDAISPMEAGACIVFTGLGFAAAYYLLNIVCNYFVPRLGPELKRGNEKIQKRIDQQGQAGNI